MKRSCSIRSLLSLSILPSFIFNGVSVWRQIHTSLMLCTLEWAFSIPRAAQINTLDPYSWHDAHEYPYHVFGHNDLLGLVTFLFSINFPVFPGVKLSHLILLFHCYTFYSVVIHNCFSCAHHLCFSKVVVGFGWLVTILLSVVKNDHNTECAGVHFFYLSLFMFWIHINKVSTFWWH